jgi:hypothetical protein
MICSENKKSRLLVFGTFENHRGTASISKYEWRMETLAYKRWRATVREAVHCIATLGASCRQSCSTSRSTLKRKFEWSSSEQYVSIASYVYVSPPRTFAGPEVHDMCQMCSSNETILFPRARTYAGAVVVNSANPTTGQVCCLLLGYQWYTYLNSQIVDHFIFSTYIAFV